MTTTAATTPEQKCEALADASLPKPRRWLRFSLRTLFVLTALVAMWLGVQVNKAQKRRAAVAAIEAAGGEIVSRGQPHNMQGVLESLNSKTPPPSIWWSKVVGNLYGRDVGVLIIQGEQLTPEMCELLQTFPELKALFVLGGHNLRRAEEALPGVIVMAAMNSKDI